MWTWNNENNVGEFTEVEHGKVFTYQNTTKEHNNPYNLPHLIHVGDVIGYPYRYAIVKKTVAYVCVDEDADGQPVFERWKIIRHKTYDC